MSTAAPKPKAPAPVLQEIYVALNVGLEPVPVGVICFDVAKNFCAFKYLPTYSGPPLDPINLNYTIPIEPGRPSSAERIRPSERTFIIDTMISKGLLHQVFVDAMPGGWGMKVLEAEYPELKKMVLVEQLKWMGSRTVGAISFIQTKFANETPVKGIHELRDVRNRCAKFLEELKAIGLEDVRNPAVASHGGAMPKASYEDGEGRHWIAKFDRPGDPTQATILEYLASSMARRCKINVPQTDLQSTPEGFPIFLSERYDRVARLRTHKISMLTLTGQTDIARGDYRDMFDILDKVCDPSELGTQKRELMRRMMVNIGLNVTDDHLRNHEMVLDAKTGYWALSPAYDLIPTPDAAPHQCSVFGAPRATLDSTANRDLFIKVANDSGIPASEVIAMADEVRATLAKDWPAMVYGSGMTSTAKQYAIACREKGCALKADTVVMADGLDDVIAAPVKTEPKAAAPASPLSEMPGGRPRPGR